VLVTSSNSGTIETIPDALSIDAIKHTPNFVSLSQFFEDFFGKRGTSGFDAAQRAFVESMAGYSVVSYFLQIKDRHNGNILVQFVHLYKLLWKSFLRSFMLMFFVSKVNKRR